MVEEKQTDAKSEVITIKKENLWKYTSVVLAIALVVVLFIHFKGPAGPTGNVVVNNQQVDAVETQPQGTSDYSFVENEALYPSIGPSDAEHTVIVFYDFQCPFCALASGLPEFSKDSQLTSQYGDLIGVEGKLRDLAAEGKIKFVFATMSFLGEESGYAGEAGLCANDQGKFEAMYDAIFTAHDGKEGNGKYNKDKLKILAKGISGVDQGKFSTCLDSNKYAPTIETMTNDANTAGVTGTPSFIVDGRLMGGSWSQISALVS